LNITETIGGQWYPNGKTLGAVTLNNGLATGVHVQFTNGDLRCSSFTITSGCWDFSSSPNGITTPFNLICSGAISINFTSGSLVDFYGKPPPSISCATWTHTGTFTLSSLYNITASTSFTANSGAGLTFTYASGGTLTALNFIQATGNVALNQALTLSGSYTLTAGTLTLGSNLTTTAFIATGTSTRSIAFSTNQITLTGNNITIWDGGSTGITFTGTTNIVSNYTGSVGTRTINVGTGWTESTDFDVKVSGAVGINIGSGGTDTVAIAGVIATLDLTGMTFTYSPGVMTVYGSYTIPATGGSVAASANLTTFASTQVTPVVITVSRSIDFPISFNGLNGTFSLGANFTTGTTRTTSITQGTLTLNSYTLTTGVFSGSNTGFRTIAFGTGQITVTGTGQAWDTNNITNLTVSGTPVVNVTNATATATTVNSGALPENQSISFNFTAGTYALTFFSVAGYTAKNVNFTGFAGTLGATAACTVYGSYTVSSGMTVTASANTLTFGGTSGTSTITTNTKTLPPVTFNGIGGTFNLGSDLTSSGLFQVLAGTFSTSASNYNITCTQFDSSTNTNVRSISLNASTVTISGAAGLTLDNTNLTFNAGTSQITLSNSTSTLINTIGGGTLYNVSFTGGGTVALSTVNTYNNLTLTNGPSAPSVVTVYDTQTINGVFASVSTNATTRLIVQSVIDGVQETISAGSVSLTDVDFQDIYAAGATIPWTGTRLGNLGNNTNITFDAGTTKYWSLVAGGNWNAIAWATSSGGTPSANNFPLAQDTCIIQNTGLNTSATITINSNWAIGTLNMSGRTNAMTLAIGVTTPFIIGNWINGSGVTITGTGTVTFSGRDAGQTITGSGVTFTPNIMVDKVAQTLQLGSALTMGATSTFTLTSGILSLNGYNLTTGIFSSSNTNTRSIVFGSNNIILAHTTAAQTVLNMAIATGFTYTSSGTFGSATGCFQSTMSVTRTFTFGTTGGTSTNAPALYLVSGASVPTITTGSYYNEINFGTTAFTLAATTQNLNSLYSVSSTSVLTALTVNVVGTGSINSSLTLGPVTLLAGTTTIVNTLTCSTFTINGATFNFTSGTITPTTSFTITSGTFTYGGTATLSAVPTFTQTAGDVTLKTYSLTATGTYTLTSGTLTLNGNLTTGIFSSNSTNNRVINFGSNNIILSHTTAATIVLSMANTTGFNFTGTGGFTSGMSVTRTFTCATTAAISGSISFTASSNQYLTPPSSTAFQFGTGDFTIEAWINPGTQTSTWGSFLGSWTQLASPGDHGIRFSYSRLSANCFEFFYKQDNGSQVTIISNTTFPISAWYHVAIVRIGSAFTLYVNGTNVGSATYSSNFIETQFWIGVENPGYNQAWFNGLISNVRFVKGVGVYTGNFTTSPSPLTVTQGAGTNISAITGSQVALLLNTPNNAGYLQDTSTNNFTVTATNGPTSSASTPITIFPAAGNPPNLAINSGASIPTITTGGTFNILDFTGSTCTPAATIVSVINGLTLAVGGTYTSLSVTSTGATSITGNSKTIAAFLVYYNGVPTINDTLTCTTLTVNGSTFNFTSGTLNPTTSITITTGTFTYGGTATLSAVPTFTQTAGSVTFSKAYALTATGTYTLTSGTLTLNGVDLTTGIFSSNNSNNRTIIFGSNNIVLSTTTAAATVLDMASTTNFLYTGTGGFTSPMSVTRSFNVGTINSISGSLLFNGSTSYLQYDSPIAPITIGTSDFTFEAWINMNSVSSRQAIWGQVLSFDYFFAVEGTEIGLFYNAQVTNLVSSGAGITTGAWFHVAAVRISGVVTFYVNGVAKGGGSYNISFGAIHGRIGAGGATLVDNPPTRNFFNGYISNFRLVKGLGVYTGNFTPSPSPLTATQSAGTNISAITGTQTSILLNSPNNAFYLTDTSSYNFVPSFAVAVTSSASTPITVFPAGGTPPNLAINSGASIPSIISGSTFNILNFTGSTCTPATASINIQGGLTLATGGTYTALTIVVTGGANVATNNKTIAAFTLNNTINSMTLDSNGLTITGAFTLTSGTMYAFGNITSPTFASSGTATRSIIGTNITYTVSGAGATAFSNASGTGISIVGVTISMTNAAAKTFAGGGGTYSVLNQGGAGALSITGANNFDNITNTVQPATVTFPSATTTTVGNFSLSGIAGSLITINSSTAASAATLTKSSGIVYGSYLSIRDSNATGGATWYAGLTSTNVSNNTGWIFTQLPIITMGNLTVADGGFVISNDPVLI
jgi:hypothetical protein